MDLWRALLMLTEKIMNAATVVDVSCVTTTLDVDPGRTMNADCCEHCPCYTCCGCWPGWTIIHVTVVNTPRITPVLDANPGRTMIAFTIEDAASATTALDANPGRTITATIVVDAAWVTTFLDAYPGRMMTVVDATHVSTVLYVDPGRTMLQTLLLFRLFWMPTVTNDFLLIFQTPYCDVYYVI